MSRGFGIIAVADKRAALVAGAEVRGTNDEIEEYARNSGSVGNVGRATLDREEGEAAVDELAILESINSDETRSGRSAHAETDEEGSTKVCKKRVERGVATGSDKR